MSLDVSLTGETVDVPCVCSECGHEHTRKHSEEFFSANITHNLGSMADEAGIYRCLWRPDENGITKAGQLVPLLEAGLALMRSDRPRFEKFNAKNGWGLYEHFIPWIEEYVEACKKYPDATVRVSR